MSYRADNQVIDKYTHTHTDRHTDVGDDNTQGQNWPRVKTRWTKFAREFVGREITALVLISG